MRKFDSSKAPLRLEEDARTAMQERHKEFRAELEKTVACGAILLSKGKYAREDLREYCLLARRVALDVQGLLDRAPLDKEEELTLQYLSTALEHYKNEHERLSCA